MRGRHPGVARRRERPNQKRASIKSGQNRRTSMRRRSQATNLTFRHTNRLHECLHGPSDRPHQSRGASSGDRFERLASRPIVRVVRLASYNDGHSPVALHPLLKARTVTLNRGPRRACFATLESDPEPATDPYEVNDFWVAGILRKRDSAYSNPPEGVRTLRSAPAARAQNPTSDAAYVMPPSGN